MLFYPQAVAYYLRQNLVQIPLIAPNYMAGSKKFRDIEIEIDQSQDCEIESDVFLYNECNPRGGHNVSLSRNYFIDSNPIQ